MKYILRSKHQIDRYWLQLIVSQDFYLGRDIRSQTIHKPWAQCCDSSIFLESIKLTGGAG
jgi:hypothetical protein